MAFWGIEVKPGKPYIFPSDDERGRLHVSQATLGAAPSGSSTKKSIVQCTVGDKKPIYLCSLLPEKLETCALNLEFEEDEEVTLSVIGPQSVHLSGFFYGDDEDEDQDAHEDCHGCDLDGMGIDSEDEDDSIDYDSEDEEDDDDLSEDDLDIYPPSPVPNSGVKIEEIVDDEKPAIENVMSKRAKKKKTQSSMSDENENSCKEMIPKAGTSVPIFESEDEDGFPVPARDNKSEANLEKSQNKSEKTDAAPGKNLKRKSSAVSQDEKPARASIEPSGSSAQPDTTENEVKQKKNKKKKVVQKQDSSLENGKPNPDAMEESPVAEIGNDLKPSSEKKKEKKKKQNKLQENASTPTTEEKLTNKKGSVLEKQKKGEEDKPSQTRTFPNGLVIEELAMGKPAGKRASPGKKVSVHYIGKLMKNGKIFDSNIGRAPFKFRLGIGQVIKGWDVGVNGMRIGDKRRITIPPAMGYGAKGCGPDIPPNAWLLFDVELVDVN